MYWIVIRIQKKLINDIFHYTVFVAAGNTGISWKLFNFIFNEDRIVNDDCSSMIIK